MPTHPPSTAPVRLPDESPHSTRIKVVGVGGGGSNAIDRMIDFGVEGVEFIALNTDVQALEVSKAPIRGQLGSLLTYGLSAGSDPDIGRRAAIQDAAEIAETLEGADMVFVTAGLGGGTGTGAAPVIAAIASEMGALTVAIVTRPFNFEGKRRMAIADWGIEHLLRYVDTLIVIPNEKLLAIAKDAPFFESFKIADDFLRQAVQSISDIITTEGVINRDFADVKTIMAGMGYAVMGTASRSGPTRAIDAVMDAMASPLLEEGAIDGARGILINITGSSTLRLSEVNAASRVIQTVAHEDANIIFGAVLDERLGDEVKATVIATGFRNDGKDRSERRARLLRPAHSEIRPEPQPQLEPENDKPEHHEPGASTQLEAHIEAETQVEPEPCGETEISLQPESQAGASTPHLPVDEPAPLTSPESVPPDETPLPPPPQSTDYIQASEEEHIEVAQAAPPEPSVQNLEVEEPEAMPAPVEQPTLLEDETFAIELYDSQELPAEEPAHSLSHIDSDVAPEDEDIDSHIIEAIEEATEETTEESIEETSSAPSDDEEQDWRDAIREIALLADSGFLTKNEEPIEPPRPEPREVVAPPHRSLAPSALAPVPPAAPAHVSNTRRAAMAAYAAVSLPETEIEIEPPPARAANAFAEVLEARRRFVENLARTEPLARPAEPITPQSLAPENTTTPATSLEAQGNDETEFYEDEDPAIEHFTPSAQHHSAPLRPLTIDAGPPSVPAPLQNGLTFHEPPYDLLDSPFFTHTESADLAMDDLQPDGPPVEGLPKPLPDFKRRLQRDIPAERTLELFETNPDHTAHFASFASIPEAGSQADEFETLDIPAFLRRGR